MTRGVIIPRQYSREPRLPDQPSRFAGLLPGGEVCRRRHVELSLDVRRSPNDGMSASGLTEFRIDDPPPQRRRVVLRCRRATDRARPCRHPLRSCGNRRSNGRTPWRPPRCAPGIPDTAARDSAAHVGNDRGRLALVTTAGGSRNPGAIISGSTMCAGEPFGSARTIGSPSSGSAKPVSEWQRAQLAVLRDHARPPISRRRPSVRASADIGRSRQPSVVSATTAGDTDDDRR